MATQEENVRYVENLFGFQFSTQHWAATALTAPGADEFDHHGNRISARYGRLLLEFFVLDNLHKAKVPPCA
jgi:hypothetical protein